MKHTRFFVNTLQLFKLLRRQRWLADKRSMSYQQNMVARVVAYIMCGFLLLYLLVMSVAIGWAVRTSHTPSYMWTGLMLPAFFTIDFLLRFSVQQTPTRVVKPYLLLPVSRHQLMGQYVLTSLCSWGNVVWGVVLLPYLVLAVQGEVGVWAMLYTLFILCLVNVASAQWYGVVRTLVNVSLWWWILPISVLALLWSPLLVDTEAHMMMSVYGAVGECIQDVSPLALIVASAIVAFFATMHRYVLEKCLLNEIVKTEHKQIITNVKRHVGENASSRCFDRVLTTLGIVPAYVRLEWRLVMRNRNPRRLLWFYFPFLVLITVALAFNVYESMAMQVFWCIYNFTFLGSSLLIRSLGYEGNYIDVLMMHKHSISDLLRAKYVFYCCVLIVPFCAMLPIVFLGYWSLYMLIAISIYTMGFQYFILFQMVRFNRQRMSLDVRLTAASANANNYLQLVAQFVVYAVPVALVSLLNSFFSSTVTYSIVLCVGIICVVTHRLWLAYIARAFMTTKHDKVEAFRK